MPGDKLGIIEQYLLGKGTYEDNGEIKSSVLGNVQIDSKSELVNEGCYHDHITVEFGFMFS